jgi:hypothetical protein
MMDARERELAQWWRDAAEAEIEQTVSKAVEYGADDLIAIGEEMIATGVAHSEGSVEETTEIGIFFYIVGKMARWRSAVRRGVRASDDTLQDIGIYVRMVQRARQAGGWPGFYPAVEAVNSDDFPQDAPAAPEEDVYRQTIEDADGNIIRTFEVPRDVRPFTRLQFVAQERILPGQVVTIDYETGMIKLDTRGSGRVE